ncbi:coiled-coil domain-containing protein [Hyunsoonleella pacifica]|uniref:Uncharacterized protein n=1 Tax=Hyunsoonleella pacifica TaxID=1080224 RepID=A0A4Q9FK46_9FLAO|nr:hypothetical protein [Hyunsoonleella pacifica]TBN13903.1 hypothetical protein EYD46_15555 [Hyunsoonleella pacifica]
MKHFIFFITLLILPIGLLAQDEVIKTKFIESGVIHESVDANSSVVIHFKRNQKCIVLEYSGQNTYKVKYDELLGYVGDEFLDITESMMDLFYDYEEQEMQKLIAEEENRQQKIRDIVEQKEKRIKDSIAKIAEAKRIKELELQRLAAIKEKKRLDSIARVEEELKRIEREKEVARQRVAALKEQRRLDSIARVEAEAKKQLERQRELERQRLAVIKEKKRLDSIVRVEEELKSIEREREQARRRAAALKEQRRLDSIARVESEAKKQLERERELERQRSAALKEKRRLDSIAQVKELEKQKLARELELARKQLEDLKKKQLRDSIAQIEALKKQKLTDATSQVGTLSEDDKNKQELEQKQREAKERLKFRDSCHYQVNEYDRFYNIRTIRTEAYTIAEHLTVELYKQGLKTNVFFNLSKYNLGCASYLPNQRSSVKITLDNGQVVSFYHSWDIECGSFLFKANLNKTKISSLLKYPIKSILLKGTTDSLEITRIEYREFFMDKLKCIE